MDGVSSGSVFSKNFSSCHKRGGPAKKSQCSQRGVPHPHQIFAANQQAHQLTLPSTIEGREAISPCMSRRASRTIASLARGLARCMGSRCHAARGAARLGQGTQPRARIIGSRTKYTNTIPPLEKNLINDKCEPKTERRHGKCGQGDQSPFKFGYSPLQVFQLSLIRARHHHCSRPTKLANSPPISSEVFRPNRRVRPVTANISVITRVRPHCAKYRRWDLVPRCHQFSA